MPARDADDYHTTVGRLLADAKDIIADVKADKFKDPNVELANWFGDWQTKFADIYTGTWGGPMMVGAWELCVWFEVLRWNPLEMRVCEQLLLFFTDSMALTVLYRETASAELQFVQLVRVAVPVLTPCW